MQINNIKKKEKRYKTLETKAKKQKQTSESKGITLIVLIITIIIMLILIGVVLYLAIDGKLIWQAEEAVGKTNNKVDQQQETVDDLMNEWDKIEGENTGGNTGGNTGEEGETTDNTAPVVNIEVESKTSNSIKVKITAKDNESGIVTNPTYTYYIKKATESTYTKKITNTNASYTYTDLLQETTYDIKVEVDGDVAGNKGTGTTQAKTLKVTSGLEEGAITFGNITWSAGKASITINTNTGYQIEYVTNNINGTWTNVANGGTVTKLSHGDTVYARLTDGKNYGEEASASIIDNIVPTVSSFTVTNYDTSSITVSASATDNESGIYSYSFQYKLSTENDYITATTTVTSNNNCTFQYTGLKDGKAYDLKVVVTDKAEKTAEKSTTVTTEIIVAKPGERVEENTPYESDGKVATIPGGFTVSKIPGEQSIDGGLVIYDIPAGITPNWNNPDSVKTAYNQFVWIPVKVTASDTPTSVANFYRSDWANNARTPLDSGGTWAEPYPNGFSDEQTDYNNSVASVYKYGGFYIGRYEAGSTTARTSSSGVTSIGIKQDMFPYNHVKCGDSMSSMGTTGAAYLSKQLYTGKAGYGVTSMLCSGTAWDGMLDFIKDSTHNVSDSENWGNYYNAAFTVTRGKYAIATFGSSWTLGNFATVSGTYSKSASSRVLLTTGASERNKSKNIYDIAGNCDEITMEGYFAGTRVTRGGKCIYYGRSQDRITEEGFIGYPAADRNLEFGSEFSSFRPVLYIK